MDKKIIEELENAINLRMESLNKDKVALSAEIEKLQGVLEIGADGKFKKTAMQEEYEADLEKVVAELAEPTADREELQKLIEKEQRAQGKTARNKKSLEALNKDKEALEAEIANLQGSLEIGADGKFKKTTSQEKYEDDLAKVLSEISEKENSNQAFEAELEDVEVRFQTLTQKYHIIEKQDREETAEVTFQEELSQEEQEDEYKKEKEKEDYIKEVAAYDIILGQKQDENREQKPLVQPITPPKAPQGKIITSTNSPKTGQKGTDSVKNNSKYKISQISFVMNNNQPVYYALIVDEQGNEIDTTDLDIIGFENLTTLNEEQEKALESKGISEAAKFYDPNIAKLLTSIDEKYGTSGAKQYQTMLKEKCTKQKRKTVELLDIDYDFSDLYQKPSNVEDKGTIKKLKRIAKNNFTYGLSSYEKEPNIFKKLWKAIKQKSLPKHVEENTIDVEDREYKGYPEGEEEEITPATILRDYEQMYDEPDFDIEAFVEGMSEPEANKYRKLQEEYEKANSKDAYQSFRDRLKNEAEVVKVQSKKSEDVQQIMIEEEQKGQIKPQKDRVVVENLEESGKLVTTTSDIKMSANEGMEH